MPGSHEIGVVGTRFEGRQDVLWDLYTDQENGAPSEDLTGSAEREPDNQYDANAIRIYIAGKHVGYVPRALSAKLAPHMDAGEQALVTGVRITRSESSSRVTYGAKITLEIQSEEAVS